MEKAGKNMYTKIVCSIMVFMLMFSTVGETRAADAVRTHDHIAPESIFSPLENPEIKDIAMLEYVLLSAVSSGKLDVITELDRKTLKDLDIDLGPEDISMEFLFGQAVYHEKKGVRLIPCVLRRDGRDIRYWCCVFEREDHSAGSKMIFFTEQEKDEGDLLGRVTRAKTLERAEALYIARSLVSEMKQDEVIRRAIKAGNYRVIEDSYTPMYSVYAFLEAVSPALAEDLKKTVSEGQLMEILDSGLKAPHPGSRGIYFPYAEKGVSPAVIAHEVFARAGFTHEECEIFKNIFESYQAYFISGNIDAADGLPADMTARLGPVERKLIARAAGVTGFVDLMEHIRERDYSSADIGKHYGTGERLYASLSMQAGVTGTETPDMSDVSSFLDMTPDFFAKLQVPKIEYIFRAIELLKLAGMEAEADLLEKYHRRNAIRIVSPSQSRLFDMIYALHAEYKVPGESGEPYMFISDAYADISQEKFMPALARCIAQALGYSPEKEKEMAEVFLPVKSVYAREGRQSIVTVAELRKDIDGLGELASLPEVAPEGTGDLVELLRVTGRFKEAQVLTEIISSGRIRAVGKKGVFQKIYSASYEDNDGREWILVAEDIADSASIMLLPALISVLEVIVKETESTAAGDFWAMEKFLAGRIANTMTLLGKHDEAVFLERIHAEGRMRVARKKGVNFRESKGIYHEDSKGKPWLILPDDSTDKPGSIYSHIELVQSAMKATADAFDYSEEERGRAERIVYPDMRTIFNISEREDEALDRMIEKLKRYKKRCLGHIKRWDMEGVYQETQKLNTFIVDDGFVPEGRYGLLNVILQTITIGGIVVGSSSVQQHEEEDYYSLMEFDIVNGVMAPMQGWADMARHKLVNKDDSELREYMRGAFTDKGIKTTQVFDNVIALLESIRVMKKAIVIVNGRGSGGIPMIDVVGVLTQSATAREKRYRELLNTVPVGIHVITPEGIIKDVNEFECSMLGYDREEIIGRPITDFVVPEQREEVASRIRARAEGLPMPPRSGERLYLRKDGTRIVVATNDTVVKNEDGKTLEIRTAMREVKALEDKARDLKRAGEVPKRVLDSILDAFVHYELAYGSYGMPEGMICRYANRPFEDLTGARAEDITGKDPAEVLPWMEEEGWRELFLAAAAEERPVKAEKYSKKLDRWFDVSAYSVEEGHLTVVLRDITSEKKQESGLAAFVESAEMATGVTAPEELYFLRELDNSLQGIVLFKADGSVLAGNRSARDILGVKSQEDMAGMNIFNDPNISQEAAMRLRKGGTVHFSEYGFDIISDKGIYVTSKRGVIEAECTIKPLVSGETGPMGYIMRIHDPDRDQNAMESVRAGRMSLRELIDKGMVNILTSRHMTSEIQMRSPQKIALVYGDIIAGSKELRKTGFRGEIRHAKDRQALTAMLDSGELAEVDIIINTTGDDIHQLLRGVPAAVIDAEIAFDRHRLQRAIIDICA